MNVNVLHWSLSPSPLREAKLGGGGGGRGGGGGLEVAGWGGVGWGGVGWGALEALLWAAQ